MKKIIIFLTLLFIPFCLNAQAPQIDERINDVYFANGILKKAEH
jgi:hypothetical protein